MNFDPVNGEFWLTEQFGGVFESPKNDFGDRYQVADGMQMAVVINPQATTGLLPAAVDQQEQQTQAFGTVTQTGTGQANTLITADASRRPVRRISAERTDRPGADPADEPAW